MSTPPITVGNLSDVGSSLFILKFENITPFIFHPESNISFGISFASPPVSSLTFPTTIVTFISEAGVP